MSSLDALLGNVWNSGVAVELGGGLDFGSGLTAVYNTTTQRIDIVATGGGGGGSGHTIEDEGVALTARTSLNFVGAGVTVADSGGKTVVTIPGGPGGAPVDVDSAAASAGVATTFSRSDHKHDIAALAVGTAELAATCVTGAKLVAGNSAGQELVWDGSAWLKLGRKTGSALGDASVTLQYTTAAQYIWPAATNTTAIRTLTLGTTGLAAGPNAGVGAIVNIFLLRASYAHNILIANGGGGGGTLFTLPATTADPVVVSFYYDGTNWALAGWEFLGTVTAA